MERDLRICSWNIQWGRGRDGMVDLGRTAATLRAAEADVICLQEVAVNNEALPGAPAGSQPERLAALVQGCEAIYCPGSDLGDGRGGRRQFGQLLLSRLPVLQVFHHRLPWPADPAVPSMQRVALEAVIATDAGALRVITTHLEFYSRTQRLAQVEALRALYAEGWAHAAAPRSAAESDAPFAVLPRGQGAILCGDFNFSPDADEYRRLQAPFGGDGGPPTLRDAWALLNPAVGHPPTAGLVPSDSVPSPSCFDFFFVSENLTSRLKSVAVDGSIEASDHQPVILDLKL
ncbi:MAG TPA: endonuclease/exonuclease/phosphatase family protein [Rhodocyclaceae bacterium]